MLNLQGEKDCATQVTDTHIINMSYKSFHLGPSLLPNCTALGECLTLHSIWQ